MLIRVLSDLHLELGDFAVPAAQADVVVLAGDVHVGVAGIRWAAATFPDTPVLYVPGNHEYYGWTLQKLQDRLLLEATGTTVSVLDDTSITLAGVRFLGSTLWTDFELHGHRDLSMLSAATAMTDYYRIRTLPLYRRLTPNDTLSLHLRHLRWLSSRLADTFPGPTVVITHHAPSPASVSPRWASDALTPAFASDLDSLIHRHSPAAWIHGHVHHAVRTSVSTTQLICNPRGYPDEPNPDFDPALVVSITS